MKRITFISTSVDEFSQQSLSSESNSNLTEADLERIYDEAKKRTPSYNAPADASPELKAEFKRLTDVMRKLKNETKEELQTFEAIDGAIKASEYARKKIDNALNPGNGQNPSKKKTNLASSKGNA